jgi:SAM-dependent methyltransferase
MALKLDEVVPFGRSFDEYRRIFALSDEDLGKRIISVADGPAGFNAEMKRRGHTVTSVDPVYEFPGREIERRFREVVDNIIGQVRATPGDWTWGYHKSPDGLRRNRERALETFLADYDAGKAEGRYVVGSLPNLPYPDRSFDIAVCSHFLFLYSEQLGYEFHRDSVLEMLRVAGEARIFPIVDLSPAPSVHLEPLAKELESRGFIVEFRKVDYEVQRGGNEMMRVRRGKRRDPETSLP